MEKETAQFRLADYRISKSLIEIHPEKGDAAANLKVRFGHPNQIDIKDGTLVYPMGVKIEDENSVINIDVTMLGMFEFDKDIQETQSFTEVNAPAILFPYLRAYITTLSSLSGIHPIILPTLNMTKAKG